LLKSPVPLVCSTIWLMSRVRSSSAPPSLRSKSKRSMASPAVSSMMLRTSARETARPAPAAEANLRKRRRDAPRSRPVPSRRSVVESEWSGGPRPREESEADGGTRSVASVPTACVRARVRGAGCRKPVAGPCAPPRELQLAEGAAGPKWSWNRRASPVGSLAVSSCPPSLHRRRRGARQAMMSSATRPWTSVRRKSRPDQRYVSFSWSMPRRWRIVAWRSWTWSGFSTACMPSSSVAP